MNKRVIFAFAVIIIALIAAFAAISANQRKVAQNPLFHPVELQGVVGQYDGKNLTLSVQNIILGDSDLTYSIAIPSDQKLTVNYQNMPAYTSSNLNNPAKELRPGDKADLIFLPPARPGAQGVIQLVRGWL